MAILRHSVLVGLTLLSCFALGDGRDRVLVEELVSVRFIDRVEAMQVDAARSGVSVELSDLVLPGFENRFEKFIGAPVSLALIDQLAEEIARELRDAGYPVVDAFAPDGQDITDGHLHMVVLGGRLGEVRVEGTEHFDVGLIRTQIKLNPKEPITQAQLEADLSWLNENPYRSVNAVLEQGRTFSETDIVLEVEERIPWRVNAGANNAGIDSVGEDRWQTGIEWGNAFGLEHRLGYQYTSAFETNQMQSHSLNYFVPLPSRHKLNVTAAYVESNGDLDDETLDLSAENKMFDFRYSVPDSENEFVDQWSIGIEYLRSNNDLAFGGLTVFSAFTDTVTLNFAATGRLVDDLRYNWQVTYSPGDITNDNSNQNFAEARFGAEASYWYTNLDLGYVMRLPKDLTLTTELRLQYANENLLSSEQLAIGGGCECSRL